MIKAAWLSVLVALAFVWPAFAVERSSSADDPAWIEGVVVLPHRTPDTEHVFVMAVAAQDADESSEQGARDADESDEQGARDADGTGEQGAPERVEVGADGRFRVAVDAAATSVQLRLEGKFVYLRPLDLELPYTGPPIVLKPELGARVTATLLAPPGVEASELVGLEVVLKGMPRRNTGPNYTRRVRVDRELQLVFDAVPAPADVTLTCNWEGHPQVETASFVIRKQDEHTVDVQLLAGASVRGRVLDQAGEPVSDVFVWPGGERRTLGPPRAMTLVRTAFTDASGAFEFGLLTSGEHRVSAYKPGFVPTSALIEVADGERFEGVELSLETGLGVEGVLRDSAGNAIRDAWVGLEHIESGTGTRPVCGGGGREEFQVTGGERSYVHRCVLVSTTTDDEGRFRFESLKVEPLSLLVSRDPRGEGERELLMSDLLPGGEPVELVLASADKTRGPVARVTGHVRVEGGEPLANAAVTVAWLELPPSEDSSTLSLGVTQQDGSLEVSTPFEQQPRLLELAMTRADGSYELELTRFGAVKLEVSSSLHSQSKRLLRLAPGAEFTVDFELVRAGGLRGVARLGGGKPAKRAQVVAYHDASAQYFEAKTDDAGRFEFKPINDGSWSLELYRSPASDDCIAYATAVVEPERMTEVDLSVQREAIDVFGMASLGGAPLQGAALAFSPLALGVPALGEPPFADYDGWYRAQVLRPGWYEVSLERGGIFIAATRRLADLEEQQLDLEFPSGSISGRLITSAGEPVANAPVLAYSLLTATERQHLAIIDVMSDADGYFHFSELPPDTYRLATGPHVEYLDWTHSGLGDAFVGALEVIAGESLTGIELVLPSARRATGTVVNADGRPVPFAEVFGLQDGSLIRAVALAETSLDGEFSIDALGEGAQLFATTRHQRSAPVAAGQSGAVELVLEPATLLVVFPTDGPGYDPFTNFRIVDEAGRESPERFALDYELANAGHACGPFLPGTYTLFAKGRTGHRVSRQVVIADQAQQELAIDLSVDE